MNLLKTLQTRFADALSGLTENSASLLDMIRPSSDPKFGDFQANCAMPLAKQLKKPPRDVAADIVERLQIDDLCETPEIAGPGFINLKLKDSLIIQQAEAIFADDRLGVAPAEEPRKVVVDFSSPNVAKPMHVGHLRSSVIGDALCRTLKFAGHEVTSDNHIGDWGTQFGMIIYGYRNFVDEAAYSREPVAELARLYKLVNQLSDYHAAANKLPELEAAVSAAETQLAEGEETLDASDKKQKKQLSKLRKAVENAKSAVKSAKGKIADVAEDVELKPLADAHPDIARLARVETSKLHAGDAENQKLWDEFLPACLSALNKVYDRFDIEFDLTLGESFYNPMLAGVVESLSNKGFAKESDGAKCVFLEGNDAPFIVQKSDGAYTYATTDLATIQYRVEELKADEILYVVDTRQSEHFNLLFATSSLWGFENAKCRHVNFGTVMGKDGKPFKTRSGGNIGLESLIDEAIVRAREIVNTNDDGRKGGPILSEEERVRVAEIVGIGGIKFADLNHNRESDYVFDWDKMLAKNGDTATYLQYAYARICGIFRELEIDRAEFLQTSPPLVFEHPLERTLALQLIQFGFAVDGVLQEYRPHQMCSWLLNTASTFSSFYADCQVKNAASDELRRSRLVLCELTARALSTGLELLGIETSDVL